METEPRWPDLPVQERLRRKFLMEVGRKIPAEAPAPEVVEPTRPICVEDLPKNARDVATLLEAAGCDLRAQHGRTRVLGTVYKSGPREGLRRPDRVLYNYALATSDGRLPAVSVTWIDGKMEVARIRLESGEEKWFVGVNALKAYLKGWIEDE